MIDKPPSGLQTRGRRFWRTVSRDYELNVDERELLLEVCRALDECEALHKVIAADGYTVAGSTGQTRVHPAVSALRSTRALVGRMLAQLGLPDEDGDTLDSPVRSRARRAAQSRWGTRGTA